MKRHLATAFVMAMGIVATASAEPGYMPVRYPQSPGGLYEHGQAPVRPVYQQPLAAPIEDELLDGGVYGEACDECDGGGCGVCDSGCVRRARMRAAVGHVGAHGVSHLVGRRAAIAAIGHDGHRRGHRHPRRGRHGDSVWQQPGRSRRSRRRAVYAWRVARRRALHGGRGELLCLGGSNRPDLRSRRRERRLLARPFFNVLFADQRGADDRLAGRFRPAASLSRQRAKSHGAELVLRRRIDNCCDRRVDFLYGYRYAGLDESLLIRDELTSIDPNSNVPVGTVVGGFDSFETFNQFHGGELGLAMDYLPPPLDAGPGRQGGAGQHARAGDDWRHHVRHGSRSANDRNRRRAAHSAQQHRRLLRATSSPWFRSSSSNALLPDAQR